MEYTRLTDTVNAQEGPCIYHQKRQEPPAV